MLRPVTYATLLAVAMLAAPAMAQEAAKATPPGTYTGDSLYEALNKLGYKPARDTGSSGSNIVVKAAQMDVQVRVSLSGNERYLWLRAVVGKIETAECSADAVRKLLTLNEQIGPAFYSYEPPTQLIYLHDRQVNRDFTPAKLRAAIQSFADSVRRQEPNWRAENFVKLGTVPQEIAQPVIDQLQGEWRLVEYNDRGTVGTAQQLAAVKATIRFEGNRMTISTTNATSTFIIDPRRAPMAIDLVESNGRVSCGLFSLEGNRLTIVQGVGYGTRPKGLTGGTASEQTVLVLEKVK